MADPSNKIAPTEAALGYTFTNKLLCVEGLQMAGAPGHITLNGSMHRVEKNTRLAVLGDAMMSCVLAEKWFEHRDVQGSYLFPVTRTRILIRLGIGQHLSKGDWDQLRQQLLSNGNLNAVGRAYGIDAVILKNAGLRQVSNEMVATTVEAIVGAAHVDAGGEDLGVVRGIMERLGLFRHELLKGQVQEEAETP